MISRCLLLVFICFGSSSPKNTQTYNVFAVCTAISNANSSVIINMPFLKTLTLKYMTYLINLMCFLLDNASTTETVAQCP